MDNKDYINWIRTSILVSRFNLKLLFTSIFLLFLGVSQLSATTYYVATNGNNANTGTSTGSPWKTITYAATRVSAGDTVYVKAGLYDLAHNGTKENVAFYTSGTSGSPISIIGYKTTPGDSPQLSYNPANFDNNYDFTGILNSGEMPLLDGGNQATGGNGFNLTNDNYIIIKNFQITNYNQGVFGINNDYCQVENVTAIQLGNPDNDYDGRGIRLGGTAVGEDSNYNSIKDCLVANSCMDGITILTGDNNTIEDCKIYCNEGLVVGGESEAELDALSRLATDYYICVLNGNYNTVSGCYMERIGNLQHGGHFKIKGNSQHNLFKDCTSVNFGPSGGLELGHRGVIYNTLENLTIIGTGHQRNVGIGIYDGASYNTFRNIYIKDVEDGVAFYDCSEDEGAQYAGHYNKFENCIFKNVNSRFINFSWWDNGYNSPANGNSFTNCTFDDGGYLFGSDRTNSGTSLTNCIVSNVSNLDYSTSGFYYDLNYSSTYCDFYNNGFSTPSGTGNFSSNPLFVDATNGDYRLLSASPCIDAGTAVTLSVPGDYDGVYRPQGTAFDVGAHEVFSTRALVNIGIDEDTGTAVADKSETLTSGTKSGAVWVDGVAGAALNFDGTDDDVNFGNQTVLNLSGSRTMSAWIKPEYDGVTYNTIVAKGMWTSGMFTWYRTLRAYMYGTTSNAQSTSNELLTLNKWHHVTMTFDVNGDKKIRLYIDGNEVTYATQDAMVGTPITNSCPFTIGSDDDRYYFDGTIDTVRVFDYALSPEEVVNNYMTVLSANLNETNGVGVNDFSSSGSDGIVDGATRVDGISGNALDFDGSNDYVDFGNPADLDLNGSRSISAWIKPDTLGSNYMTVAGKGMWASSIFADTDSRLRGYIYSTGTAASSMSSTNLSTGVWQHVTMTFDVDGDKKIRLYVNGEETGYSNKTAMTGTPTGTSTYDFSIGSDRGINYFFDGSIDEVKMFNQALYGRQIFDEYALVFGAGLNESSGNTVHDSRGNNGTLNGGAYWSGVAATGGYSLFLDGTDDYADFGNPAALELTGSRTIMGWIMPDTLGVGYMTIAGKGMWGSSLFSSDSRIRGYIYSEGTSASSMSSSSDTLSTGEWQHVAMTFDADGDKKIYLYVNGEEVSGYSSQTAMSGTPASTAHYAFAIGSDRGDNYFFDGRIDEVKVFRKALTAQQIMNEYALVLHAPMNEGSGDKVYDDRSGNHGERSGATWTTGTDGGALDFDGTDDDVNFGKPAALELTGNRTIAAWIYPDTLGAGYMTIAGKGMWASSLFIDTDSRLRGYIYSSGTSASSMNSTNLSTGTWQHVAMTFDSSDGKIRLYVNGSEVSYSNQTAMSGTPASTANYDFAIGSDRGLNYFFDGKIDDVKVFNRKLSSSQIQALYNSY